MRLLGILALSAALASAEQPTNAAKPDSELYKAMAGLDTELFETFNTCNLTRFAELFEAGAEFYHDQSGLTIGSAKVTEQLKENICGKARRELVPGSLVVYPMHGYGAFVIGSHRFYQVGQAEPTGIARFAHLWQKKDSGWKLTRVISYDHVGLTK